MTLCGEPALREAVDLS